MQTNSRTTRFSAKDFIVTAEGLGFAVVDGVLENGRVLCFLRYVRNGQDWRKYSTDAANALLASSYPQYLFYSAQKDAHLHAVPVDAVVRHYKPREQLQALLRQRDLDPVQQDLVALCGLYRQEGLPLDRCGVTGSLLLGAQHPDSDLDLVVYDRNCFQQAREITKQLFAEGVLQELDAAAWQAAYERRDCELSFDEYVWHEQRKLNKGLINGRKFDLSFVTADSDAPPSIYRKLGNIELRARVKDARFAFDYPALLLLEHPEIGACVSYTATYSGQAETGEWVEIRGALEQAENGERLIVVGSSREAQGEYIRVVHD